MQVGDAVDSNAGIQRGEIVTYRAVVIRNASSFVMVDRVPPRIIHPIRISQWRINSR